MPNGGGTEDRVRATLVGAFVLNHELNSGKRLPPGGRVYDIDPVSSGGSGQVPKLGFRVVSAAFNGLSSSERTSLVHEALLEGALNGPLHGASIQPTGGADGTFDVFPPATTLGVHHAVEIDARTHDEVGEGEPPQPGGGQVPSESPIAPAPANRREVRPTDRRRLSSRHRGAPQQRKDLPPERSEDRRPSPSTPSGDETILFRHHHVLWTAPIVLLVIAILPLPYAYYTFLRLSVCAVSAYLAYQHFLYQDSVDRWVVLLGAVALLYNPFVPIYLTREIWIVLNLIAATTFVLHLVVLKRHLRSSDS